MIKAIVFDLDDTLIPETEYVKSGFRAIAKEFGSELYEKLWKLFCEDRKNVYQRAGFSEEQCKRCIEIYRNHFPDIKLDKETEETLVSLKEKGYKLGIITDGRPGGQRNKIKALGLDKVMDYIIVTDELGGEEFRKPNPKAFEVMREKLQVEFDEMMYVGDNPKKDFYIGSVYPITTVRVLDDGLYNENSYYKAIREKYQIDEVCKMRCLLDEKEIL